MGAPTVYTEEIASRICERLASGESLDAIGKDECMPSARTVRRWLHGLSDAPESFCQDYASARLDQADFFFDQLVEIGVTVTEDPNSAKTNAYRLKADNVKWVLARMNRGKYGDRAALDLGNQPDNPLATSPEAQARYEEMSEETREGIRKLLAADLMSKAWGGP